MFSACWFNDATTEPGLDALGWYHEKRDEERDVGLGPEHDWSFTPLTLSDCRRLSMSRGSSKAGQSGRRVKRDRRDLRWLSDRRIAKHVKIGASTTSEHYVGVSLDLPGCISSTARRYPAICTWVNDERVRWCSCRRIVRKAPAWFVVCESASWRYDDPEYLPAGAGCRSGARHGRDAEYVAPNRDDHHRGPS